MHTRVAEGNLFMRTLLTLILLTFIPLGLNGQVTDKNLKLTIRESTMAGNSYYEVTPDSILIMATYYSPHKKTTEFKKALSKDERQKLEKALLKIEIKELKDSYFGQDVSDDNYEFEFTFDVNGTNKKTRIYEYKHKDIFELVRQINLLLPENYLVHYDEKYCKNK